jgi:large conductance mechanosensitive channel
MQGSITHSNLQNKIKKEIGEMTGVFGEFKKFALRGNVIDLAVGIIIGGGFNALVSSLVNDVIMPPIGRVVGKVDFKSLYINLSGQSYPSLEAAKAAGAATINYGNFLNSVITFLITAFAVFLLVRFVNRLRERAERRKAGVQETPQEPTTKQCPYCFTEIPIKAVRCPACTSDLQAK